VTLVSSIVTRNNIIFFSNIKRFEERKKKVKLVYVPQLD